jgi:DNA-binding winged helix-turn-helix (wHTH) protein
MSEVRISAAGYRFDGFHLDARNRQLWREGEPVALNSKYFDVLLMLVSRKGELVEKQRIFDEIWEGVFVTDAALTQCIKDIRRQLGDDASSPRYIKTVPKHGYIFIGNAAEAVGEGAATALAPTPPPGSARPYKFLDYYTEQDTQLFFGRETEVEAICSQIIAHRSCILYGRSGVGKSSILRAGLMPRLKSEGHLAFAIRSFSDPLHQMTSALCEVVSDGGSQNKEMGLEELMAVAGAAGTRYVIFFLDQFEEFFSLLAEESRQQFIDTIGRVAAREDLPLRLVFALREDFLAEMSRFKPVIPEIFHHEYRLTRLNREQASLAITAPAHAVGCEYEPMLVERLLEDLNERDSIDPPQLQIVCDSLYDSRDSEGRITTAAYDRLGTASQILAGYLERVLNRFDAPELRVTKAILTALISIDGRRLVLRASDLVARVGYNSSNGAASAHGFIEELVAARVVRRSREDGETWLELAHDFLTPEVSQWLTDEERSLKQARGIIERAIENYRAHDLMIDADALDVLFPFGEQLGLTGEEADLLATSAFTRGLSLPAWLIRSAPNSRTLIVEASRHEDPGVRLSAVEASQSLREDAINAMLWRLALWDRDLGVRKAASIALAVWFQEAAGDVLSNDRDEEHAGPIRRAVSLAIIRDYDKRLVRLHRLSVPVSLLVVLGLMWVRVRRNWSEIVREGIGGVLGGALSGVAGGLMLGSGLAWAQGATAVETAKLLFVLVSLGTFIGTIGAFGVSFGMVVASYVAYRHSRWWPVVGGAAGGAAIGGVFKLLGIDILRALFGQNPDGIAGSLEGALLGAGVSMGAVAIGEMAAGSHPWRRVLASSLGAMCAGIALTVIGGNLFSGSLEIVARSFADSQIKLDPLAPLFGEVHFGKTTQIIFGAIEGLLFGFGVAMCTEGFSRAAAARDFGRKASGQNGAGDSGASMGQSRRR